MVVLTVLKIDPVEPDDTALERAAACIRQGGLVVAPTETRYGLLARADRQDVLEKLYRVKNRDLNKPTAVLVREIAELSRYGAMSPAAERLAKEFLPGPLTLVLEATEAWPPPRVVEGKIGLRFSSAPLVSALLGRLDMAVTATSANISGRPDHDSVEGIASELKDQVDLYLDGGALTGPTSTVVDCSGPHPRLLREGAITREEIARTVDILNG